MELHGSLDLGDFKMGWFWGKRFHFGTRTDDRITGSSRSDIVFGFGGDDEISTRGGRDTIFAGHGDDTIHAGAGNDFVAAGRGDDLIFDGAGSDTVKSGHGDDTVVFVSRDNIGYHDRFDGGRGQDTLRLELTSQDWTADVREEVQAFLEFVAANTRTNGDTNGRGFTFDTLGLTVRRFEKIEVLVDGVLVDPTGDGNAPPTVATHKVSRASSGVGMSGASNDPGTRIHAPISVTSMCAPTRPLRYQRSASQPPTFTPSGPNISNTTP